MGESKYTPTIGLEVHAQLKTATKMFCNSKNDPDESEPNVNICPVCMGHPGTLPVINKAAVHHVLRVGTAVGGQLADFTEFDRKNYFYPDIPKGYQISQYKYPLVTGGSVNGVELTRIHLEEDTALSKHEADYSLVDFNRAGIPLMELVTEPVMHSAEEVVAFARELRLLLRALGASDANMEKGELRLEANISVSGTDEFGTKVEVKNLNSFKAVERATQFEIKRQIEALENGEELVQETRGWDENRQKTFSQRSKESAHDYRYFPDPDLPKLVISEIPEFSRDALDESLPELPREKRKRYQDELGLKKEDADMFVSDAVLGVFFDNVARICGSDTKKIQLAANYIAADLAGLYKASDVSELEISSDDFVKLIDMLMQGDISSRGAKDTLKIMFEEGGDPKHIAQEKGLLQKSDEEELKKIVEDIIAEHTAVAEEYKAGKEASLKFLIGQGMKATQGSANPQLLKQLLENALSK